MTTRCRSCDAEIMFVRIESTGKPMPVDPFPDPDGNVYARHVTPPGGLLGRVARNGEPLPEGWRVYMPHFATCPNWRKSPAPMAHPDAAINNPPEAQPDLFTTTTEGNPS